MEHVLLAEFNKIKKDIVLSFTKYSISGNSEQNKDAVLQSVLFSWFYPLMTINDFQVKYDAFVKLDKKIEESCLFDLTELLSDEKDVDRINKAISIYYFLNTDKEYLELAKISGYRLPTEFSSQNYYEDGSLIEKIDFYHTFKNKLDEINEHLTSKGVVRK